MVSLLWINILEQNKRITAYQLIGYHDDGRNVLECCSCLIFLFELQL